MSARLAGLWVHPIKSLRGVAVPRLQVRPAGPRHDRRWMLVDERGTFVTQRTVHRLALAEVALAEEGYRVAVEAGSVLVPETLEGPRVPVRVWSDAVQGVVHAEGSALLSDWLGQPLRLIYLPDDVVRPAGDHAPGARVSLADAYPYLLIGQASLDDLNARIEGPPMTMSRFRPNLVAEGSAPFAEDGWSALRIGEVEFVGVKRCDRCVLTTVDPETGQTGPEPLRTLATYRREQGKVWFGMNLVPRGEGVLAVGDPIYPCRGTDSDA